MAVVAPVNAALPVAMSYSTAPKLNRSERASSSSPRACSGDMKGTVPTSTPGVARSLSVVRLVEVRRIGYPGCWCCVLCYRKFQNLDLAPRGDEYFRRLDVAMQDS